MDQQLVTTIKTIIAEILGTEVREIGPQSEFLADLNASPAEMQEIIKRVEEELDLELEYEDMVEDIPTVGHLFQLVEEAQI